MAKQSDEVTVEFFQAFAHAWNRHDVDDLMSFMTDDCVFESSAGEELRNGPRSLDSAISEICRGFQAANTVVAKSKYTASGVRRSSAL
jgi:ketosteroid isomerase-like protein